MQPEEIAELLKRGGQTAFLLGIIIDRIKKLAISYEISPTLAKEDSEQLLEYIISSVSKIHRGKYD